MSNTISNMATLVLSLDSEPGEDVDYQSWHQETVDIVRNVDGLKEVNLIQPIAGVQDQWMQVLNFGSTDYLSAFLDTPAYKELFAEAKAKFGAPFSQQIVAGPKPTSEPVTVVISQIVKQGCADRYQKWQVEMDAAARKFPGFLGTELIKPVQGLQDEWVVVFRFDTSEHLDEWFASDVHAGLLKEGEAYFDKVRVRRVGRGFEDWFANAAGEQSGGPAQWKVAMVVVLTLYPTVMLLTLFLSPLMSGWTLPNSMFVSNVCSVAILTWLVMPVATRALGFWLDEETGSKTSTTILGGGMVVGLYAAMIAAFSVVPV